MSDTPMVLYPQAMDLMVEARNIIGAAYPLAHELELVESMGLDGFVLEDKTVMYNPVSILNEPFNDLITTFHSIYITWYLRYVPIAALQPIFNRNIH